jgi:hypothetical protein
LRHSLPGVRVLAALFLALLAGSCASSSLPKTYPATGSVVYRGGQPLTEGAILFPSTTGDPLLRVLGEIAKDGTFVLRTQKDNQKIEGAPAGDFEVQVLVPFTIEANGGLKKARKSVTPIALPHTYKVEEKENTFRIELPNLP